MGIPGCPEFAFCTASIDKNLIAFDNWLNFTVTFKYLYRLKLTISIIWYKNFMSNFEKKEQNLNQLIDKLNSISLSYSQPNYELEKIETEKKELANKKKEIEKQNRELMREHKYLKEKVKKLQLDINKKSKLEEKFNQDIEDLSQETESLVSEIDKWQM